MNDAAIVTGFRAGRVFSRSISILFRNIVPFGLLALAISAPKYAYRILARIEDPMAYMPNITAKLVIVFIAEDLLANLVVAALVYGTVQQLKNDRVSPAKCVSKGSALMISVFGIAIVAAAITALPHLIAVIPRVLFSEALFNALFEALVAAYESSYTFGRIAIMSESIMILLNWVSLIPALYIWVMLWVTIPVAVVERRGLGSLRRSMTLTRGCRWRVFSLLLLLFAVDFGVALLKLVANGAIHKMERAGGAGAEFAYFTGQVAVEWLVYAFVGALSAVIIAVSYHDLRVAKEGVDTTQIAAVFD